MRLAARTAVWTAALAGGLFLTVVGSAGIGPVPIDPVVILKVLLNALAVPSSVAIGGPAGQRASVFGLEIGFSTLFAFEVPPTSRTIVMTIRLPRILLGAIVGVSLSAAGAVMQGFFRNPMADPSIIGVSSGAAVGAVAAITLPLALPFGLGLHAAAFGTGLITAFGVYMLATQGGRTPVATLLLAGIAVQTFLGAVISYMLVQSGESLQRAVFWLMGHLHTASWAEVEATVILVPPMLALLLAYSRDLNVLLLGEEDARTLGIDVERTKRVLLGVSTLATAAAVAVSGVIGFVGLIVPHMMRLVVGPDHRILLPTSALAGGVFLVLADTVARSGPAELPVGIVTAAVGAPFFLYLLRRREVYAL